MPETLTNNSRFNFIQIVNRPCYEPPKQRPAGTHKEGNNEPA